MVDSPCVKLCQLNAADICVGCGRTRAEIGAWSTLSDALKRQVVEAAAARRKTLAAAPRPPGSAVGR
jgi:uncharacterized protein